MRRCRGLTPGRDSLLRPSKTEGFCGGVLLHGQYRATVAEGAMEFYRMRGV